MLYWVCVAAIQGARALRFASSGNPTPSWRFPDVVRGAALHGAVLVLRNEPGVVNLAMQDRRYWLRTRRTPGQVFPLGGSGIGNPGERSLVRMKRINVNIITNLGRRLPGSQPILLKGPINRRMLLEVLKRVRRPAQRISHDDP